MSRLILFFQSKVALAIIGAVLLGGGAALAAAGPFGASPHPSTTQQPQSYANISSNGNGTATPGSSTPEASPAATPTSGTSPTATPTRRPPTPTPTPGIGQPTSLRGSVTNVNTSANLFKIRLSTGSIKTVTVTPQTTFTGACTSLGGLRSGWQVDVQGAYQADGSFAATAVNSWLDD
jgi:hypothetical protein